MIGAVEVMPASRGMTQVNDNPHERPLSGAIVIPAGFNNHATKSLRLQDSIPGLERRQMSEQPAGLIARLAASIADALDPELLGVPGVALLDFPDYPNAGDSAIYLGQLEFLRSRYGLTPRYVCREDNFSPAAMTKALGDGVVLLQGGGNFGDIWPRHQRFREAALATLQGRRVIQLPQSIHFRDPANLRRAAEAIAAHGNFLLLVRDRRSADIARAAFRCEVRLCPDMAFALGPLTRTHAPRHALLLLLRADAERSTMLVADPPGGAVVVDWASEPEGRLARSCRRHLLRAAAAVRHGPNRDALRAGLYQALARHRIARGIALLSSGRSVITDRLHGHILCVLLGIPHVVLDNSYGKVSGFIDSWTHGCDLVGRAGDVAVAIDHWRAGHGLRTHP